MKSDLMQSEIEDLNEYSPNSPQDEYLFNFINEFVSEKKLDITKPKYEPIEMGENTFIAETKVVSGLPLPLSIIRHYIHFGKDNVKCWYCHVDVESESSGWDSIKSFNAGVVRRKGLEYVRKSLEEMGL